MNKLFENDLFIIYENLENNFIVENKHDFDIKVYLIGLDDYLEIDKNSSVYLFEGMYTECIIDCLMNESYEVL